MPPTSRSKSPSSLPPSLHKFQHLNSPPPQPQTASSSSSFRRISMAAISIVSAICLLLLLYLHLSAARNSLPSPLSPHSSSSPPPNPALIRQVCRSTRFPDLCSSSSLSPSSSSPSDIILAAIAVSSDSLHKGQVMVKSLLDSSSGNPNRTLAAKTCLEVLDNSDYRTGMAVEALPRGAIKDVRAWLSAALVYQYACWSGLKYVNDTAQVSSALLFDGLILPL